MMELKSGRGVGRAARQADSAERCDRAKFRLTAQRHDSVARRCGLTRVTNAVAICADKVAFRSLSDQPSETSVEVPKTEVFGRWVSVMKLQCLGAARIATVNAPAAVRCDEVGLPLTTPLSQRTTELLAAPVASRFPGLLGRPQAKRNLRRVVIAEARAFETETSPVERAHLAFDDPLCRKDMTARDTNERLAMPQDWLSRSAERLVRTAIETVFAAAEVASPTFDKSLDFE